MKQSKPKVQCMGCPKLIPADKTICAGCAEDMGFARRAK